MSRFKAIPVKEAAYQPGITKTLIYHWFNSGVLSAIMMANPYLSAPSLVSINYYTYTNKYNQRYYGRKWVKAIPNDEFEWLLFIRDKWPSLLNCRNTELLKSIKRFTYPLKKEVNNEQLEKTDH